MILVYARMQMGRMVIILSTIYDRIKAVRKSAGLTQQEFADELGLKRNTIATYETAKLEPSDRTISDICRVFNINEEWLRSGEGEMMRPKDRGEEIADIARAAAVSDPDEAAAYFRSVLSSMSDGEILLLYELVKRLFPRK